MSIHSLCRNRGLHSLHFLYNSEFCNKILYILKMPFLSCLGMRQNFFSTFSIEIVLPVNSLGFFCFCFLLFFKTMKPQQITGIQLSQCPSFCLQPSLSSPVCLSVSVPSIHINHDLRYAHTLVCASLCPPLYIHSCHFHQSLLSPWQTLGISNTMS